MELELKITPPSLTAHVDVASGLLYSPKCIERLLSFDLQYLLLADAQIEYSIASDWIKYLQVQGLRITPLFIEAKESLKSRETKQQIEDQMLIWKMVRDTGIIALGGGVITDLAGFLAATYCRGVPLFLAPTTLLAMVDAAFGGKTGLNTEYSKNSIGAFHLPRHVFIDPDTLKTLPAKEWKNGMAEVIKYALIESPSLFETLLNGISLWECRDPAFIEQIIQISLQVKHRFVQEDFFETGLRRGLNFGHTIGHAIELLEDYRIPHGEAVAIGMAIESRISHLMGYLNKTDLDRVEKLLHQYGFTLTLPSSINKEQMLEAMTCDKKSKKQTPRFVLLEAIGKLGAFDGEYCTAVPSTLLNEVL